MRKVMAFTSLAVLGVMLAVAGGAAAQEPERPAFWVGLDFNGLSGEGWLVGGDVTVTADDPTTFKNPDITLVLPVDEGGGFHGDQVFAGLEPGWFITVADGVTIKTHTVRSISITGVDPATDIVRGSADPYSEVRVSEDHDLAAYWVEADAAGNWSADFSDDYDIVPGSIMRALRMDDDGDFTFVDWQVPTTLGELLDDMVADGRLPNEGVANSILKQAEKAPLKALTNHLKSLVNDGVIAQQTMDQILAMVAG
jgi:hypothetical protein